jgi:hypothetical protein
LKSPIVSRRPHVARTCRSISNIVATPTIAKKCNPSTTKGTSINAQQVPRHQSAVLAPYFKLSHTVSEENTESRGTRWQPLRHLCFVGVTCQIAAITTANVDAESATALENALRATAIAMRALAASSQIPV